MSYKINAADPKNLSNKVLPEKETRRRLLLRARENGNEKEVMMIFDKYDKLLKNCTDEQERKDIAHLGAFEIYTALGRGGELYVDGQLVAKDN